MKTNYSNATMLDMIFEHRNKAFGAYVLRRDYNNEISRAILITISSVFLLCFGNFIREHVKASVAANPHICDFTFREALTMAKKEVKPATPPKRTDPPAPRQTSKNPQMTVVTQAQASDTVPETKDVQFEPGLTNNNPLNAQAMGTEGGTGSTIGEKAVEQTGPTLPVSIAEIMPEYPGGNNALMRFLADNTEYPEMEKQNGIGGKVVTQFTVNEDGSISDIAILRSPGNRFDKEVTRVIKILRPFKPGLQQGKPVRVRFVLPFTFKTND